VAPSVQRRKTWLTPTTIGYSTFCNEKEEVDDDNDDDDDDE